MLYVCTSLTYDIDCGITNSFAFKIMMKFFCINNNNINKHLSFGEVCLLQC